MTGAEWQLYKETQRQCRNIEFLKERYDRMCDNTVKHTGPAHIAFREHAMKIYDRVVPVLLADPRIFVMPFPSCMLHDHVNNELIGTTAFSRMLKGCWSFDRSDEENLNEIVLYTLNHYQDLFGDDWPPEAERYKVHKVGLYHLLTPCDIVVDPQNGVRRIGFMTRYSKRRLTKKDVPSFNYDEGDE